MLRRTILAGVAVTVLGPTGISAQEPDTPSGWKWRADHGVQRASRESAAPPRFDQMPPGWHVTTGPSGLLYPANEQASGQFSLIADFVVFPETTDEEFGIFLGGSGLDTDSASYLAALLRRDGSFSVQHRRGSGEAVLVEWTRHAAIKEHPGSGVVTNRLRVNASADSLRIFVNDSSVARVALGSARTPGRFGFRVGEGVNLHLTILDHIRHLAPARTR